MSQSFNKIGQILKEHCGQDNESYEMDVLLTAKESRIVIKKHVNIKLNMANVHYYEMLCLPHSTLSLWKV